MKNEKGITLVELLVAVVIAGIIIVPLLTIMTGTFTRTVSQGKETQIAYVAQEVMEKIRLQPSYLPKPITIKEIYCILIIFRNTQIKVVMDYYLVEYIPSDSSEVNL